MTFKIWDFSHHKDIRSAWLVWEQQRHCSIKRAVGHEFSGGEVCKDHGSHLGLQLLALEWQHLNSYSNGQQTIEYQECKQALFGNKEHWPLAWTLPVVFPKLALFEKTFKWVFSNSHKHQRTKRKKFSRLNTIHFIFSQSDCFCHYNFL